MSGAAGTDLTRPRNPCRPAEPLLRPVWRDHLASAGPADTIIHSGQALESAGYALTATGQVPWWGDSSAQLGRRSRRRRSPSPLARECRLTAAGAGPTPWLVDHLDAGHSGRRAIATLRIARWRKQALRSFSSVAVRALSEDPWADIAVGRTKALPDIELRHLGLPPRRPSN